MFLSFANPFCCLIHIPVCVYIYRFQVAFFYVSFGWTHLESAMFVVDFISGVPHVFVSQRVKNPRSATGSQVFFHHNVSSIVANLCGFLILELGNIWYFSFTEFIQHIIVAWMFCICSDLTRTTAGTTYQGSKQNIMAFKIDTPRKKERMFLQDLLFVLLIYYKKRKELFLACTVKP